MTKIEEIEQEIKRLESKDCLTYDIVHKLVELYTLKKYMVGSSETRSATPVSGPMAPPLMK